MAYFDAGDGRDALTRVLTAFAALCVHREAHAQPPASEPRLPEVRAAATSSGRSGGAVGQPGYVQGMAELAAVVLAVFTQGGGAAALRVVHQAAAASPSSTEAASPGSLGSRSEAFPGAATRLHDEAAAFWTFSAVVLGPLRGSFDDGLEVESLHIFFYF
jgi:hypothetical protein